MSEFYVMQGRSISGEIIPFSQFLGKVVLIVNTASACGFTPQYAGLNALYHDYASRGFTILAFPCDQFGHQEPGDNSSILQFCTQRFDVQFPLFEKIDVNEPFAHPLYQWLSKSRPGLLGPKIRWNFTKFLLDRKGKIIGRYASSKKPEKLRHVIEKALRDSH